MRVVVAMSGGVDSSAAAALLKEQGHEVIGITLRVWSYEGEGPVRQLLQPGRHRRRPRAWRRRSAFRSTSPTPRSSSRTGSSRPFVQSYLGGRTPIPCVACNQDVKFDFLLKRARALGAKLATGHYARVERAGRPLRARAAAATPQGPELLPLHARARTELAGHRLPGGETDQGRGPRRRRAPRGCPPATSRRAWRSASCPTATTPASWRRSPGPQPAGEIVDAEGQVLGAHDGDPPLHRGPAQGPRPRVGRAAATCSASTPHARRSWSAPASGLERLQFGRAPAALGGPARPRRTEPSRCASATATPVPPAAWTIAGARARLTVRTRAPARAVTPGRPRCSTAGTRARRRVDRPEAIRAPWTARRLDPRPRLRRPLPLPLRLPGPGLGRIRAAGAGTSWRARAATGWAWWRSPGSSRTRRRTLKELREFEEIRRSRPWWCASTPRAARWGRRRRSTRRCSGSGRRRTLVAAWAPSRRPAASTSRARRRRSSPTPAR